MIYDGYDPLGRESRDDLNQGDLLNELLQLEKAFEGAPPGARSIAISQQHPSAEKFRELGILNSDGEVEKSRFFQTPQLWHRQKSKGHFSEAWTETGSIKHPLRPKEEKGVLYKRYVPTLQKTISFEVLDIERHLEIFHKWHNQRRVYKFWELNQSKEELKDYLEKVEADPHHFPVIAAVDGVPSGYFEIYWGIEDRIGPYYDCLPHDRGLHFLIGNPRHLGRDYFNSFVESISHYLFLSDSRTSTLLAEPRSDNNVLLHYLNEFPYWKHLYDFDFPHKRASLLTCKRDDFFRLSSFA